MSVVVTTTVVVASQVATSSIIAPIALAGGIAAGFAVGAVALGNALTSAPFWKDIEKSHAEGLEPNGFCNLESFQADFLNQTERHYERLLQISTANLPTEAYETVAALMTLQNVPLVAAVAEDRYGDELHAVLNQIQTVQDMGVSEIASLNRQTADLLENSLDESSRRVQTFVARELESAMQETGWTVKDKAQTTGGAAYLATSLSGQSLAVCLDKNGTITTDMAGFSGRGCEQALDALFSALEKRGIRLNRKKEHPHYLFAGGSIINRASKAEQILENAERHRVKSQKKKTAVPAAVSKKRTTEQARKGYVLNRLRNAVR